MDDPAADSDRRRRRVRWLVVLGACFVVLPVLAWLAARSGLAGTLAMDVRIISWRLGWFLMLVFFGSLLLCAVVVGRTVLEDLGLLQKREEWHDWRSEPLPPPSTPQPPARREPRRMFDRSDWTHRGRLRRLRGEVPRKHWGYNRDSRGW